MTKSVYIHIPFCKKICSYCAFCKFLYNENWVNEYLKALKKEIADRYMDEKIKTLYIGGGSPSSLNSDQLKELLNILSIFKMEDSPEITIECNLNDLTDEFISILEKSIVNRVSIGIESFDENNLSILNRSASFKDALLKINKIRAIGINNINVDLMYALPFEDIKVLKKDLHLFCKLPVTHISSYSLMIEENTGLYNTGVKSISEDLDAKMYKTIQNYLKRKKFIQYEISNFSKKGYESKHNLTYWNNDEYYGFGVSAAGYVDGIRYENTKNLRAYLNGNFMQNKEILSLDDKMKYELILGLRKLEGINVQKFYERYSVNIQNKFPIESLIKNKDLIYKNGYIFINPDKLYVENEILLKLV